MNNFEKKSEEIIEELFKSMQRYVQNLINSKSNLMNGLYDFANKAWEVPKKYKGNSKQMGFIPEYLVFETVKQYIKKKRNFSFISLIRSKIGDGRVETIYFVNDLDNPTNLISQGLSISEPLLVELGLPYIKKSYDVIYLIKKKDWKIRAIFEVKGFFESPSLKSDIERLTFAEENYPLDENYALVFVGFKIQDSLSKEERKAFNIFAKEKNHFCIIPGEKNPELGNSWLEEVLERM